MSIQSFSRTNKAVQSLPKHLLQFAVDQRYEEYTPVDHAVWRFIMRQNIFFLKEYAHKVYFKGLLDTGISFERIPRIEEMNDILGRIDWGAVAVDGPGVGRVLAAVAESRSTLCSMVSPCSIAPQE